MESSTSSSSSTSNGDISDQDMDVSEIPLALAEGEEASQALVPLTAIRPTNPAEAEGGGGGSSSSSSSSSAVSVYRPGRIVPALTHPHAHFRVMPPTSINKFNSFQIKLIVYICL